MNDLKLNFDFDAIRDRIEEHKQVYKPVEWAKKIGVSKAVVSNIHGETDGKPSPKRQNPSLKYIIAVSIALRIPIDYFMFGKMTPDESGATQKTRRIYSRASDREKSTGDMLANFSNKKKARECYEKLLEIDHIDPDKLNSINFIIHAFLEGLRPQKKSGT